MQLEKLKKRLAIIMLVIHMVCFSFFTVFYFSQGLLLLGFVELFVIFSNVFWIVMIFTYSLDKLYVWHQVFCFGSYCITTFFTFIGLNNGFLTFGLWYIALPISVIFLLTQRIAFAYALIGVGLFFATYCAYYIFGEFRIISLTTEQADFLNFSTFAIFLLLLVYAFFCNYQIEKLQNHLAKITKKTDFDGKNREWQKLQTVYYALIKAMEVEKLYENPDLTMPELAEHLNTNHTYIYKAMKQNNIKDSFQHFINYYRIKAIKEKIDSGMIEQFTIGYLYQTSGFKQQSSFNRIFRQFEGITPREYIKMKKSKDRQKTKNNK